MFLKTTGWDYFTPFKHRWANHQGLYTWTQAFRTLFVYKDFTKKKVFEQLTLLVVFSQKCRYAT